MGYAAHMSSHSYDTAGSAIADPARAPGGPPIGEMCSIFGALSDPTRLRILLELRARELSVSSLSDVAGVSQSAVSHQLRTLRDLNLVACRREGKLALYRLADDHVTQLVEVAADHARELGGGTGG